MAETNVVTFEEDDCMVATDDEVVARAGLLFLDRVLALGTCCSRAVAVLELLLLSFVLVFLLGGGDISSSSSSETDNSWICCFDLFGGILKSAE